MRVSTAELDQYLRVLRTRTGNKIDYDYSVQLGKYRLTRNAGSAEISDRFSKKEMCIWMDGYIKGVSERAWMEGCCE